MGRIAPKIAIVFSALMILSVLSTTVAAFGDSSKAIMISKDGRVDEGTNIGIEVHCFDEGVYTNPTIVQAFDSGMNEVSLTERSPGIWGGTVEATEDNVIMANIEIDEKSDSTAIITRINQDEEVDDLDVHIEAKDPNSLLDPQPGDRIVYQIEVFKEGKPADEDSMEVFMERGDTGDEQKLAHNKISIGVYESSYTVPTVTESTYFSLHVEVNDGGMWPEYYYGPMFEVNFFQVWYHKKTISTTESTFEVYVADMGGKKVIGATVNLQYDYQQTDIGYVEEDAGQASTDNDGKATYTITYTKVDQYIYLQGTVVANGKTQEFSGSILITSAGGTGDDDPPDPMGWGLEVIFQESDEYLVVGKKRTLQFKAWYTEGWFGDPEPLTNQVIYYYAYSYNKVVKYGTVTTDANGLFTLDITPPSITEDFDYLSVEFETQISSGEWEEDSSTFAISKVSPTDYEENPEKMKDDNVKISVDTLKVGGKSHISAKYGKSAPIDYAFVGWVPGRYTIKDMMSWEDTQPEWEQLTSSGSIPMSQQGNTYSADIVIPEFMSKGTYTIYVIMVEEWDAATYFNIYDYYHINYLHLTVGSGGSTNGDDKKDTFLGLGKAGEIDLGYILIGVILVVVIVVVLIAVFARRKKPEQYPAVQQQAPGAYPAAQQQPVDQQQHHQYPQPGQGQPPPAQPPPGDQGAPPPSQPVMETSYSSPPPPSGPGPGTQQGGQPPQPPHQPPYQPPHP